MACEEGYFFVIFCLPSRVSCSFSAVTDEAVDFVMDQCDRLGQDVYATSGVFAKAPSKRSRGLERDVAALQALFADIDVKKRGATKRYPPSIKTALKKICVIGPHKPSFYVLTGGGIHPYWLFMELLLMADSKARMEAKKLLAKVNATHQEMARASNWEIDSIRDLCRVLRVPGTKNHKYLVDGEPVDVILVKESDTPQAFAADDFDDYVVALDMVPSSGPTYSPHVGMLDMSPDASLSDDTVRAVCSVDEEFETIWNFARQDFGSDVSKYDLAIANKLAAAQWTPQQIADAITHFRRDKAGKPKLRLDYYQRTIAKAIEGVQVTKGEETIKSRELLSMTSQDADGQTTVDDVTRNEIKNQLRSVLKLNVDVLRQSGRDKAHYQLGISVEGGTDLVDIGAVRNLRTYNDVSDRILEHFGVHIRSEARGIWEDVVDHMLRLRELKKGDGQSGTGTFSDQLKSEIARYCASVGVRHGHDAAKLAVIHGSPFMRDGQVYVSWEVFAEHMRVSKRSFWRTKHEGQAYFASASTADWSTLEQVQIDRKRHSARYWPFVANGLVDSDHDEGDDESDDE